jgi:ATP phosphoribosyltransferase regulatory subunit
LRLEKLRRRLLDGFSEHGYELVIPPLLEYIESLLIGSGRDLDLRTFKLVDQLSGRSMGVRADITPQVARTDAHLLNRQGVTRLCYCGSVLHTLPAGFSSTREPLQIGAEIYGHAGLEADIEIIRLLAETLGRCGLMTSRLDLGHVEVFRALIEGTGLASDSAQELFGALQEKDLPTVRDLVRNVPEPMRSGLLALPQLYGDRTVLQTATEVLPKIPAITRALGELRRLADALGDLPVSFDLADLRGYHYHSGVAFAAYCSGSAGAIARGGRYDLVGQAYGRARPATGFSLDLREIARLAPETLAQGGILAPWPEDDLLHAEVVRLRGLGERVVLALPGHDGHWGETGCDRVLLRRNDQWIIESLKED